MVTSGSARQSSRCAIVAGRAASASASAASEKASGRPCAAMAMRLIARSVSTGAEPLDDPRGGRAEAALAQRRERDQFAVARAAFDAGGHEIVAARRALLDRLHAAAAALQRAIDAERTARRLVEDFDDAAASRSPLSSS